ARTPTCCERRSEVGAIWTREACPKIKLPPVGGSKELQSFRSRARDCQSAAIHQLSNTRPLFHPRRSLCSCSISGRLQFVRWKNVDQAWRTLAASSPRL